MCAINVIFPIPDCNQVRIRRTNINTGDLTTIGEIIYLESEQSLYGYLTFFDLFFLVVVVFFVILFLLFLTKALHLILATTFFILFIIQLFLVKFN